MRTTGTGVSEPWKASEREWERVFFSTGLLSWRCCVVLVAAIFRRRLQPWWDLILATTVLLGVSFVLFSFFLSSGVLFSASGDISGDVPSLFLMTIRRFSRSCKGFMITFVLRPRFLSVLFLLRPRISFFLFSPVFFPLFSSDCWFLNILNRFFPCVVVKRVRAVAFFLVVPLLLFLSRVSVSRSFRLSCACTWLSDWRFSRGQIHGARSLFVFLWL